MHVAVFREALERAIDVVAWPAIAVAWSGPSALAGYTVGGLAAHLAVATGRTAALLDAPEPTGPEVRVVSLAGFYGPNRIDDVTQLAAGLPALLRDDGERRAAAGPAAVVADLRALLDGLPARLAVEADGRLVPVVQVAGGASRLDDYLVTRVIELVVHTDDLAVSVGRDLPPPSPVVLRVVTTAFMELAIARSGPTAVLRAFTRRERGDPDDLRVL